MHTYIIGHYNTSIRIIDLSTPNDRFFEKLSWQFYLLSEFLPEICWGEIGEEILFVFRFDVRPGTRTLAFRLISTLPTRPRRLRTNDLQQFSPLLSYCYVVDLVSNPLIKKYQVTLEFFVRKYSLLCTHYP